MSTRLVGTDLAIIITDLIVVSVDLDIFDVAVDVEHRSISMPLCMVFFGGVVTPSAS